MRTLRTKTESIACFDQVASAADRQFDTALQHITKFLSIVLQISIAPRARFDMIDVTFQKMASDVSDQRFEPKAFSLMHLIRFKHRTLTCARDDMLGVILLSKETTHRHAQGGCDTVDHLERWVCPAVFNLGQNGFRTAGSVRDLLHRQGIQETGMSDLRSNTTFSSKSV